MTVAIVLGSLLLAALIVSPVVYEIRRDDVKNSENVARSVNIPNPTPIPIHIPMVAMTTPTTYPVPYYLGGFAVTTPSPATWTLPSTYVNGGPVQTGQFLQIRNYGPGTIKLVTTSPETIEGATNYTVQIGTVKVLSSPNWLVTTPLSVSADVRDYGAKCDGVTDDTAAIQIAINAVARIGGTLLFPAATCMISSLNLQSPTMPVTLSGTGVNSVLKRLSNVVQGVGNMLSLVAAPNTVIEGLNFVNYPNASIGTLYKDNCISTLLSPRVVVRDCHFDIGFASGVLLVQSKYAMITGNRVYAQGEDPANPVLTSRTSGAIYVVDGSGFATIENNIIETGSACIAVQAIASGDADITGTVITGNVIRNCSAYGIIVYSLGSLVYDTTVTGNTIEYVYGSKTNPAVGAKSFGAGIYVQRADKTTVTANVIAHTNILTDDETLAPGAISTANTAAVTISANTILDPYWYGVYVATSYASPYTESGPIISGNTITTSNTSRGVIKLNSAGNVVVEANQIQAATIGTGIYLLNSTYGVVSDNLMNFPYGYNTGGIYIESSIGIAVRNNYLRSNVVSGSAIIVFVGASYTVVESNYIRAAQIGIRVYQGATTKLQNNFYVGSGIAFYFDTSSSFYGQNYGVSPNELFQGPGSPIRLASATAGALNVGGALLLRVNSTATPIITSLTAAVGAQPGQIVSVTNNGASGDVSIVYSATTLKLAGSVNLTLTPGSVVTFMCLNSVAPILWQEMSRTIT
jgi:parallel beta-helix repeat protein